MKTKSYERKMILIRHLEWYKRAVFGCLGAAACCLGLSGCDIPKEAEYQMIDAAVRSQPFAFYAAKTRGDSRIAMRGDWDEPVIEPVPWGRIAGLFWAPAP